MNVAIYSGSMEILIVLAFPMHAEEIHHLNIWWSIDTECNALWSKMQLSIIIHEHRTVHCLFILDIIHFDFQDIHLYMFHVNYISD